MTIEYVVSIVGHLLYFDAQRQRVSEPPASGSDPAKLHLALLPPDAHPASSDVWHGALGDYTNEQRASAEISRVVHADEA